MDIDHVVIAKVVVPPNVLQQLIACEYPSRVRGQSCEQRVLQRGQRNRLARERNLVALAVSFLVNDTPTDVAGYGGLAAVGLWLFARSEEARGWDQ